MANRKGTNAERELLHAFWAAGWVAMRAPASGAIRYPCPDLLVGNLQRKLAIECKATGMKKKYVERQQIEHLLDFCRIFGAEPWLGVRFTNKGWYFLAIEDIEETAGNNFVISRNLAQQKGLLFEELLGLVK